MEGSEATFAFSGAAPFDVEKSLVDEWPKAICRYCGQRRPSECEMHTSVSYPETLFLKISSACTAPLFADSLVRFDCPAQPDVYDALQL